MASNSYPKGRFFLIFFISKGAWYTEHPDRAEMPGMRGSVTTRDWNFDEIANFVKCFLPSLCLHRHPA